jgi:hypothetical protein
MVAWLSLIPKAGAARRLDSAKVASGAGRQQLFKISSGGYSLQAGHTANWSDGVGTLCLPETGSLSARKR